MQFFPVDYYYQQPQYQPRYSRRPHHRQQYVDFDDYLAEQAYAREMYARRQRMAAARAQQEREERMRAAYEQQLKEQALRRYYEELAEEEKLRRAEIQRQRELEAQRKAEWERQERRRQAANAHQQQLAVDDILSMFGLRQANDEESAASSSSDSESEFEDPAESYDDNTNVAVADEDYDDYDVYANEEEPKKAEATVGSEPTTPEAAIADFVDDLTSTLDRLTEDANNDVEMKESSEEERAAPETTQEPESEESELEKLTETLKEIEDQVDAAVATYERLFNYESSSDSESDYTVSALKSRIKILQKTQFELEKCYTTLDLLPKGSNENRKIKRGLTSRSLKFADKVDDLLRTLESRKTMLLERESSETESEPESDSDNEMENSSDEDSAPEEKEPEIKQEESPKRHNTIRRVIIETVPDEDDF
ncbi:hypothetical protein TRVA0_006S01420 [Trichomonascus vanleenenianus]|uniref:uncharacterized protein n=1 Tax=Trichomonascus vanleenenianus TaxID=2268995 RepID=UPI003ECA0BB6